MSDSTILLAADNLQLWRGDQHVLRGTSFTLGAGQCLQVLGPNGAGKSSLLRAIVGLLPLEAGTVSWRGVNVRDDRPAFHRELAWLGHSNGLKAELTPAENLHHAFEGAPTDRAAVTSTLARFGLDGTDARPARRHSAGQQRRMALARIALSRAVLWVLDEPTANLDAAGQSLFAAQLGAHLQRGGAALIATHMALQQTVTQVVTLELG